MCKSVWVISFNLYKTSVEVSPINTSFYRWMNLSLKEIKLLAQSHMVIGVWVRNSPMQVYISQWVLFCHFLSSSFCLTHQFHKVSQNVHNTSSSATFSSLEKSILGVEQEAKGIRGWQPLQGAGYMLHFIGHLHLGVNKITESFPENKVWWGRKESYSCAGRWNGVKRDSWC